MYIVRLHGNRGEILSFKVGGRREVIEGKVGKAGREVLKGRLGSERMIGK